MSIEIVRAEDLGFCFGVKRAINMILKEAKDNVILYSLGPIIHNPQEVERLKKLGVITVNSIDEVPDNSYVIIRSHGIPKEEFEKAKEKNLKIIDATCPFVKKAQMYVANLSKEGYKVVVVGKPEHPEVKGLVSYGNNTIVIDPEEYYNIPENERVEFLEYKIFKAEDLVDIREDRVVKYKRVGFVAQTTLKIEDYKNIINDIMPLVENIKVYNTICDATRKRQEATRRLAKIVDLIIVIGGKNSSNTNKLYSIAKKEAKKAYFIETKDELNPEWFKDVKRVGISAGASTPDWIIKDVEISIKKM